MTASVYVIGGAGAGKSTFTAQLLIALGGSLGDLQEIHMVRNSKNVPVVLRGHVVEPAGGLYIGRMRTEYPGTDGLDRASSISGEEWLERGGAEPYRFVVAEGATLSTRRFLYKLHEKTDLLLVHLHVEDFISDLRFLQRGSAQSPTYVKQTCTRAVNLLRDMKDRGALALDVDSDNRDDWDLALKLCVNHLS